MLKRADFRSKFEFNVAKDLQSNSVKFEYEKYTFNYRKDVYHGECIDCGCTNVVSNRTYTPDFKLPSGIFVEAKGKFTPTNRTLMLDVIKSNPDLDVRMLFMRDNWLTSKKKKRYSDWCIKKGIKYAIGRIPSEWY